MGEEELCLKDQLTTQLHQAQHQVQKMGRSSPSSLRSSSTLGSPVHAAPPLTVQGIDADSETDLLIGNEELQRPEPMKPVYMPTLEPLPHQSNPSGTGPGRPGVSQRRANGRTAWCEEGRCFPPCSGQ